MPDMSHLLCTCGAALSDTLCPCPTKFWLTSDTELEDHTYKMEEGLLYRENQLACKEVWACSRCGALGIEVEGVFHWFKPEESDFRLPGVAKGPNDRPTQEEAVDATMERIRDSYYLTTEVTRTDSLDFLSGVLSRVKDLMDEIASELLKHGDGDS